MEPEDKKLDRLISILKESKPVLEETDDLEESVINRIRYSSERGNKGSDIFDYIFGWVYIGWVRTSFIAASILIIVLFAYQQSVILKRINSLNQQAIIPESQVISGSPDEMGVKSLLNKFTGFKIKTGQNEFTEEQIEELLQSINELKVKYKDLIKIIEEDPDLKKEIEKKLNEQNLRKFKL